MQQAIWLVKTNIHFQNHDKMFSNATFYVDFKNELSFCIHVTELKILTNTFGCIYAGMHYAEAKPAMSHYSMAPHLMAPM